MCHNILPVQIVCSCLTAGSSMCMSQVAQHMVISLRWHCSCADSGRQRCDAHATGAHRQAGFALHLLLQSCDNSRCRNLLLS